MTHLEGVLVQPEEKQLSLFKNFAASSAAALESARKKLGQSYWLVLAGAAFAATLVVPLAMGANAAPTATSSFEYDESGLLIREVIEPDSPQNCLQTSHSYNAQGNPSSKSSSACAGASGHTLSSAGSARGTTREYLAQTVVIEGVSYASPAGTFATRTTNALNHSESYEYDPRHGQVVKLTGPNGGVTTWAYDSFGRKTRENRADGTYTVWDYRFCQVQGQALDPVCATSVSDGNVAHTLEWYPRNSAVRSRTRVTYWPEMPKSTAISTLSWLKSSATVRYFRRRPPERLSLTKSMLQTSLTVRASCSGTRSLTGRLPFLRRRTARLACR